jgi:hypothetical protein
VNASERKVRKPSNADDLRIDDDLCRELDRRLESARHRRGAGTFRRGGSVRKPRGRQFRRASGASKQEKELEDYWRSALDRISILEFKLDHAAWDERRRELNVVYEANLNGERKRACEIMQFDAAGRQIKGEAFYGAAI